MHPRKPSRKPIQIPPEVWELIREQTLATELNILVLIRLSRVSRSARQVFSSDKLWKNLDPYGFKKNIYSNFCNLANSLPLSQQTLLWLSWSWGKRYRLVRPKLKPDPNQSPGTYTRPICSQGLRAWGYTLDQIRGIRLDPAVNLYTKMGILRPDCYSLLDYPIDDPVFLKCLVHHHPGAIRLADPKMEGYGELRYTSVMLDFAQGGVCSLTLEGIPSALMTDKRFVIELLKVNPNNLEYVSPEMARDRDVVFAAVSTEGKMIENVPDVFKYDIGMNLAALNAIDYDEWLEHLEGPMMECPEIAEAAVKNTYSGYKRLPRYLRKVQRLCYLAVSSNGRHLKRLPYRYRKDPEIVMAAVEQDGLALKYAHASLQENKKIVLCAVRSNGRALRYTHASLRDDRDIVFAAVSTWGKALKYAKKFCNDKELVMAAMAQDGNSFKYACEALKNDEELIHLALISGDSARGPRAEKLKEKKEIALSIVKQRGMALQSVDKFLGDKEVVTAAVENSGMALQFATLELRADKEVVLKAVKTTASAFQFASSVLRTDYTFALECVKCNPESMAFVGSRLQDDPVWTRKAVELTL